jgi:hypothetical protein
VRDVNGGSAFIEAPEPAGNPALTVERDAARPHPTHCPICSLLSDLVGGDFD